ncbi:alpha-ketoglutarate-dependent dioxygenase AlkB family protein [Glaciecola petra]|uniref:Alpha-ketoglutarate-dependent dioxygenase AlkB n=1 Tax=Glaciecola petra TaxID=3075602 RepID=A0ABU2ZMA8_9ALTE|nr:alpha-ketoglutarate-dependent dioxygenase AlkB [Aestuariibacter sp. P117]MDT0593381.1 alpha-ketoglutarate-dependent dioxygenase AlkB [Aestuariibacter sp. P117]
MLLLENEQGANQEAIDEALITKLCLIKANKECLIADLVLPNAKVDVREKWLSHEDGMSLYAYFYRQLAWQQAHITLYGKQHKIPRLQAWYGDPNTAYKYSGLLMQPLAWDPVLKHLKTLCEETLNVCFNSVLANLYRDGSDSMGMHADDEPELGVNPTIASVSLGQTRRFTFKQKQSKESVKIELQHSSLLTMAGQTQTYWQHGMNKSRTQTGPRINFTFRFVHPA